MGEGLSHWSSMVLRKSQTCFSDRHTHPNSMYSNFCHVLKFFVQIPKTFVQKIIEKAAEEKIKDLVPKKNSTRSFCNIMRLVW